MEAPSFPTRRALERTGSAQARVGRRLSLAMSLFCFATVLSGPASSASQSGMDAGRPDAAALGACGEAGVCAVEGATPSEARPPSQDGVPTLLFFWATGCHHCAEAESFVDDLEKSHADLRVERIEVRQDAAGRRRFLETMTRLGVKGAGVPTFVVGDEYTIGYAPGETEEEVAAMLRRAHSARARQPTSAPAPAAEQKLVLRWIGGLDIRAISLPVLTIVIGLVDGVNPCAMWILIVLLGILLHVGTRRRMVLYATTFILMSGLVYFGFMTAWAMLFDLVGLSSVATRVLGGVLLVMGLANMKELIWFRKGVSLVIPRRAKPGLYRRMRGVATAAGLPAGLAGVTVLAFVVNLVELGCTLGLPAAYTRLLSVRELSPAIRYGYIALYNVAYVIPLLAIAFGFIGLRRRITMSENAAKVLKLVSGLMLTASGLLFVAAPSVLVG